MPYSHEEIQERIYPKDDGIPNETLREHTDRYTFATNLMKGSWVVLDAACGSGYGTNMLAQKAKKVTGIDIDTATITYANKHYGRDNIDFKITDIRKELPFSSNTFDAVVSFETVEHIVQQEHLINEFWRIIKPGGLLIISTPDKNITVKTGVRNHYHPKELSKAEFLDLVRKRFRIISTFGQTRYKNLLGWQEKLRRFIIRIDLFNLRRLFIAKILKRKLGLQTTQYGQLEKTTPTQTSQHLVLMLIAQKQPS